MEQKYSGKESLLISTLATMSVKTDKMDFTHNDLIAVTAAGIIQGTFIPDDLKETFQNDPAFNIFDNIRVLAAENGDGSQKSILLKDATLTNHGMSYTFNYLHLFIDDIIALSFGHANSN